MAASVAWELNAEIFAGGTTLVVLLMAALLLREQSAARRRHESLAHEQAILAATLTGMSDGIMMVDSDLNLLAWNQHFPEFTGVPAEILRLGLPMEDILRAQALAGEFGPVDVEVEVARRLVLLRAGATMGTIERARPTGRHLEIRRNSLPGGGFVTLYTDVTARHQAEDRMRQAQTMAAVGRLTSGVAHDFNNLLVSISGNAEMLHNQLAEHPTHARRLAAILQAASRGADLVRQLLAFSRKQTLEPVMVDLNQVVRGISDLLRATLGRTIRVEWFQRVELLTHTNELQGLSRDVPDRNRAASASVAIHLRQDYTGDAQPFVEFIGRFHCILSRHGVGHEQNLHRVELFLELLGAYEILGKPCLFRHDARKLR
jgi:signal transduction histidine kinase